MWTIADSPRSPQPTGFQLPLPAEVYLTIPAACYMSLDSPRPCFCSPEAHGTVCRHISGFTPTWQFILSSWLTFAHSCGFQIPSLGNTNSFFSSRSPFLSSRFRRPIPPRHLYFVDTSASST